MDKCYRIIGFPSDFKFTRSKRVQGNVRSNIIFGAQEADDQPTMETNTGTNQLTKDQFLSSFSYFTKLRSVKLSLQFHMLMPILLVKVSLFLALFLSYLFIGFYIQGH